MKVFSATFPFTFLIIILLSSCNNDDDQRVVHTFSYDFETGTENWTSGFSDYPADWDKSRFEFQFEHTELPEEINENSRSLLISGRNTSDDLFMFIKNEITDLKPNHSYSVSFEIELASQYPQASAGIGGSPGASVYLKAGGSTIEPIPTLQDGNISMNIDKGNQSQGGEDMQVLGNIGISGEEFRYQIVQLDNFEEPIHLKSDDSGKLWIIIGTDSGFEGTTTLYYNRIEVKLEE